MKTKYSNNIKGFAIIEILIAITILSITLSGIISGVSAGIVAISGSKDRTIAMIIAKNSLNEFIIARMRGTDITNKQIEEYPGFTYDRETKRFEHELFGPLDARRVEITVRWQAKGRDKDYSISYVYPIK